MASRTALLVGATGLVGRHCLGALLADPDYAAVTVLARRPLSESHPKLHSHVIDFDEPGDVGPRARGQDVFCCLGTTIRKAGSREAFYKVDFTYPVSIAEAALANAAEQFLIVSATGAGVRARAFYSRVKGEVEAAVARMPFRAVHIFRPSLLVGDRDEFRLGERLALALSAPMSFLLKGRLRRYAPIEAATVASCMVRTARQALSGVRVFESEMIAACHPQSVSR